MELEIKQITDKIIELGKKRLLTQPYQDINAAIYSVKGDISLLVQAFMAEHKDEGRKKKHG